MHKTQFLNLFDANKLIDSAKDFDKICIKPELLGISYFYKFENDTLNSILIDSDYQFDKK